MKYELVKGVRTYLKNTGIKLLFISINFNFCLFQLILILYMMLLTNHS